MTATAIAEALPIEPSPALTEVGPAEAAPSQAPNLEAEARAGLMAALQTRAAAEDALIAHHRAVAQAESLLEEAREKLEEGIAGTAAAKAAHAASIAASIAAGGAPTSAGVRAARAAELEAKDAVDANASAVEILRGQIAKFEDDVGRCEWTILEKRNAIIALHLERVLERAARARAEFWHHDSLAKELANGLPMPEVQLHHSMEALRLRTAALAPLDGPREDFKTYQTETRFLNPPEIQAWSRWARQLLTNPDAQPPELPRE